MFVNSEIRTKLFKLFEIELDSYKYPYTTKYELLLPDLEICLVYSHSSGKYFVFYVEDFPKPYEEITKIVEAWHKGSIVTAFKPVTQYPTQFQDNQLQTYAASINPEVQSDIVLLFEVSVPTVKQWYYQ